MHYRGGNSVAGFGCRYFHAQEAIAPFFFTTCFLCPPEKMSYNSRGDRSFRGVIGAGGPLLVKIRLKTIEQETQELFVERDEAERIFQ